MVSQALLTHEGLHKFTLLLEQFKKGLMKPNVLNIIQAFPKEFLPLFTFRGTINAKDVLDTLYTVQGHKDETAMELLARYINNLTDKGINNISVIAIPLGTCEKAIYITLSAMRCAIYILYIAMVA